MAGIYTFANFKSYLTLILGNRTGLSTYLPLWVNAGYTGLCSINKVPVGRRQKNLTFPELDTFTDSAVADADAYITRPSDCLHIHTVWDMTNDKKLDEKPREWYVQQTGRQNTSSEGKPDFWIPGVYPKRTYIYPTSDGAYNMRTYHRKRPTRFVEDTDTSEIGEEWDEAILQFSAVKAHMWLRDFQTADIWRNEFAITVGQLIGMTDKETKDFKGYMQLDQSYNQFGY